MNPQNDPNNAQVGIPRTDQPTNYHVIAPPRQQASTQQAAADVIRGQLNTIYSGNGSEQTPHTTPVATPPAESESAASQSVEPATTEPQPTTRPTGHGLQTAPPEVEHIAEDNTKSQTPAREDEPSTYRRTMDTGMSARQPSKEEWQQYHSAWQKYYQMYYERYYIATNHAASQQQQQPTDPPTQQTADQSISQQRAMRELRASIRKKVADSATKVKKSRHFIPAIAGISVLLIFMFLQYNRVVFGAVAAYVSPGNIDPQNIIVDPTLNIEVGPEPRMVIPKINVDAPVVYGVGPDYNSQMTAMEKGIAHFSIPGANAVPGEIGNAVFAAHSSNDVFASGDYKFVFAQNEKLTQGDIIYMNFEGTRYTYSVTSTEVVLPSEVSKVQLDTNKPMLTLVSCVPLGTAEKRLLIFAEQVSPDPGQAASAQTDTTAPAAEDIPGRPAPTLLEKIFGIR